jgi:glycogen debranching enzyme
MSRGPSPFLEQGGKRMKRVFMFLSILCSLSIFSSANGQAYIEKFSLQASELHLEQAVQPRAYFDCVGQKSAILGTESGNLEVWIYPYKVLHNFQLYFLTEEENEIIEGSQLATKIDVYPHQTILRYTHSSFTVEEIFFTPLKESGAVILISVETVNPISIVAGFTPDLKPMWPAGLGGQYSYWEDEKKYFVLSEGTGKNVALVGSPAGERFSSGPAHALPEGEMKVKIKVTPEGSKRTFYPIFFVASHESRSKADEVYSRLMKNFKELYLEKFQHFEKLRKENLSLRTPDEKLNQAFEWAKKAVDEAFVCNPQLGCGLVAGYGLSGRSERPGFDWFFGGDAFFNSWAITSCGSFDVTRQALAFIRSNQRQDGKIMHELSQGAGFIRWFEDYPYGFYHADTTPYYIVSMGDYLNWSGDFSFIKESWTSLKKAYQYVLSSDKDGDGLMENTAAGLAALELGAFLKSTKSDIYLASLSAEAHHVFSELAELMGEKALSREAKKTYDKALQAVREKFWVEEERRYAHALTVEDKPLMETTVWPSVPLFFRQLPQERADDILDLFACSEMSTDWGVRSLSPKSTYYDPVNYNYGSVWPFLTGYVSVAEYNYGRSFSAFSHLMSLAHNTFINALGDCPELFSAEFFMPLEEAVPHQIFSSSPVITCLVRGLLGLRGSALEREIEFGPNLPGKWDGCDVRNFRIGNEIFDFLLQRSEDKLVLQIEPKAGDGASYRFLFCPSLGYGTRVKEVRVNGEARNFSLEDKSGEVRLALELEAKGKTLVEVITEKAIFIDSPLNFPQLGQRTSGLKLIRAAFSEEQLRIMIEGLGGKDYILNLITSRPLVSLKEAELVRQQGLEKKIKIKFEGKEGDYSRKEVVVQF